MISLRAENLCLASQKINRNQSAFARIWRGYLGSGTRSQRPSWKFTRLKPARTVVSSRDENSFWRDAEKSEADWRGTRDVSRCPDAFQNVVNGHRSGGAASGSA